jgi:hypothetical protein
LLPRDERRAERESIHSGNKVAIVLKVDGAEIEIPEIYDRPLYVIYAQIREASGRLNPAGLELL